MIVPKLIAMEFTII